MSVGVCATAHRWHDHNAHLYYSMYFSNLVLRLGELQVQVLLLSNCQSRWFADDLLLERGPCVSELQPAQTCC